MKHKVIERVVRPLGFRIQGLLIVPDSDGKSLASFHTLSDDQRGPGERRFLGADQMEIGCTISFFSCFGVLSQRKIPSKIVGRSQMRRFPFKYWSDYRMNKNHHNLYYSLHDGDCAGYFPVNPDLECISEDDRYEHMVLTMCTD